MKKLIFSTITAALLSAGTSAQVTQDFESGSRNAERLNCWQFWSTSINGGNNSINGQFAMRSGQMSNMPNQSNPHRLISPWVDMTPGNITFDSKLTALNGGGKYLDVLLIDENNNTTTILQHQYSSAAVQSFSIPVNVSGFYQVEFQLYGSGGNSRGIIDDVSIPGTYAADPSNNPNNVGQCPIFQAVADADGDGVDDANDEYPNDASKAYNNYMPGANSFNTLAFEDLWPAQGDYDFNDLVVDYRFNEITNASNNVVEIEATFYVRAVGGTFDNGFAIQLDNLTPSDIASVTGQQITGSLFSISGNGTEAGQSNAVIPVFDNAENVINRVGGSMYNTISANGTGISDTVDLVITLSNPQASVGTAPYNPFIVKDQQRDVEIHLADKAPTDLANTGLFGTGQDDSNVGSGKYYKTENNLPWALDVSSTFEYPVEGEDIIDGYLKFVDWAQSGGTNFTDWYTNTSAGYRNNAVIY